MTSWHSERNWVRNACTLYDIFTMEVLLRVLPVQCPVVQHKLLNIHHMVRCFTYHV